jgi:hypothetical protein
MLYPIFMAKFTVSFVYPLVCVDITGLRRDRMDDRHVMELKQALIAVMATAASMGIDIDELSDQAAGALADDEQLDWFKQFTPGAVRELQCCRDLVKVSSFVGQCLLCYPGTCGAKDHRH